jgi:hypothetical protein
VATLYRYWVVLHHHRRHPLAGRQARCVRPRDPGYGCGEADREPRQLQWPHQPADLHRGVRAARIKATLSTFTTWSYGGCSRRLLCCFVPFAGRLLHVM